MLKLTSTWSFLQKGFDILRSVKFNVDFSNAINFNAETCHIIVIIYYTKQKLYIDYLSLLLMLTFKKKCSNYTNTKLFILVKPEIKKQGNARTTTAVDELKKLNIFNNFYAQLKLKFCNIF